MGLYPKYEAIPAGDKGAWFAGSLPDGRIVGLATVSMQAPEAAVVDGFTHWRHAPVWHHLIEEALAWAWNHGAQRACAYLCGDDAQKQRLFARLGFRDAHRPAGLELAGTRVACLEMEKRAGS
jgi:N-acetylglutamate synthase-like GNAT family acetyltransferase